MKKRIFQTGLIAATLLASLEGCQSGPCNRPAPNACAPTPGYSPPPGFIAAPAPPTPTPVATAPPGYLPPSSIPTGPPQGGPAPANIRNYPPGPQPSSWKYPTDSSGQIYAPGIGYSPPPRNPALGGANYGAPPRSTADSGYTPQRSIVQLRAPEVDNAPPMPRAQEETRPAPSAPPLATQSPPSPTLGIPAPSSPEPPKGIPQFAVALDRVASGQRPFEDGFAWLKQEGYRTVLHLRTPGEDDSADKEMATQRGLEFRSIEVSPSTLTDAVVDEFDKIVGDANGLPLFVYDRDGTVAGALWYLHFRSVAKLSEDEARKKADRLGFRDNESTKSLMVAIQKYLNDHLR